MTRFGHVVYLENLNRPPARQTSSLWWRVALVCLAVALASCSNFRDGTAAADRAQALLNQHRIAEARVAIREAISEDDQNPSFYLLRGKIEVAAESWERAYAAYRDALALDSNNVEALVGVSQLGLRTGHEREATEATDAILAKYPNQPDALQVRGIYALLHKRYAEAVKIAEQILLQDPANDLATVLKTRASFLDGKRQVALETLDKYNQQKKDTAVIALTKLEVYRALRNAKAMGEQYKSLRRLEPKNIGLRIDEANFDFKTGQRDEGVSLAVSQLANPGISREQIEGFIGLWREYGVVKLDTRSIDSLVGAAPANSRLAVAEFLADNHQFGEAQRLLEGMAGDDKVAVDAKIAALSNKMSEADKLASLVLKRDKTHCLALTVHAEALLGRKNGRAALDAAQIAASQCPSEITAWKLVAEAYSAQGDDANALRALRQGMNSNPQDEKMAHILVDWLLTKNRFREAIAVTRRLTHNAPSLLSGWRLYRDVCDKASDACAKDAEAGLADAATQYGIDAPPGTVPPPGLMGPLVPR